MNRNSTELSVEEQIFDAFFSRLNADADLIPSLPQEVRRLYESGNLVEPSAVIETIVEAARGDDADDAS